jgi:molybdate transport system substrate-binding protein
MVIETDNYVIAYLRVHAYELEMVTTRCPALLALALVAGCGGDASSTVPINLLAAGATQSSITDEMPTFSKESAITVNPTFGAVGALRDMVIGGTPADVMVVTPAIITTLDGQNLVHPNSRVDLGQIGGGLAVKAGAPMPDISTPDALKQVLLNADAVYYADPTTATAGAALMTLVDNLGIGDAVRAKGHTASGGAEAMQAMADASDANPVGATQVSEILSVSGVTLVGQYPAPLQVNTTYSAIIVAGTKNLPGAQLLVDFFHGPEFQARLAKSGFEPVPAN